MTCCGEWHWLRERHHLVPRHSLPRAHSVDRDICELGVIRDQVAAILGELNEDYNNDVNFLRYAVLLPAQYVAVEKVVVSRNFIRDHSRCHLG